MTQRTIFGRNLDVDIFIIAHGIHISCMILSSLHFVFAFFLSGCCTFFGKFDISHDDRITNDPSIVFT